jgi:starvation-inducible DNA-binding protein
MHALEKNLQELLSTVFVLYVKTLNYHWNVTGKHFRSIHKMLDDNYVKLAEDLDTIAEHMRALGMFPAATCADFIAQSQIKEVSGKKLTDMDMLKDLEAGHRVVIEQLKKLFEAAEQGKYYSTTDVAAGLSLENEKMAWMFKSYFE